MTTSEQLPWLATRARDSLRRLWPGAESAARRAAAERLYRGLVNQARMAAFYRELGVPDTPEGRFEMVGLHVALAIRRLRAAGAPGSALAQELFDLMFADMDESLRHLGIGDLSVGKQIRRLAGHFYARLRDLDRAMASVSASPLAPMLRTNLYHGGGAPLPHQLDALASYVVEAEHDLRAQVTSDLLAGQARWPQPAALERGAAAEPEGSSLMRELPEP